MRNLVLLLGLAIVFMSCEGPQGPPGFDGNDGGLIVAQSYEFTEDFVAPDFGFRVDHPNLPEPILETDMILVYILWDVVDASDGGTIDIWRLLPQTVYSDDGEFSYNYESTFIDVDIFIDGPASTNFDLIPSNFTTGQTFRTVILPVDLASDPRIDFTDYNSVMNFSGLAESEIMVIE